MTDSQLQDALKSAKYNEAVILTVASSSSDEGLNLKKNNDRREIVLVPSLDIDNGGVVWKDACTSSITSSLSSEIDVGISRHIRTKKWVIPMLNDDRRNKLYDTSIKRGCKAAIEKILDRKQGDTDEIETMRVLDIGSGTGLLAMMAAKHSLDIAKEHQASKDIAPIQIAVSSVEMASAMARLACKTISNNSLDKVIHVTEAHSSDEAFTAFVPSSAKANVCTSELLESGLLGEGIIPALRDAWQRHLCEDAIVIPQKARVYAQVIECSWITNFQGPNLYSENVSFSTTSDPSSVLLGGNNVVPVHAEALLSQDDNSSFNLGKAPSDDDDGICAKLLSEPKLVLEFDFTSKESIPSKMGRSIKKEIIASDAGKAHGVLFWWDIDLYGETYSTMGEHWQDHWQQCVFVFGSDVHAQELKKNEPFILTSSHDDYIISFQIEKQPMPNDKCNSQKRQKISKEVPRHISSERALQLNDKERFSNLSQAIKTALEDKGMHASVLDLSDFSLCSLIAATQLEASNITSIESSYGDIPMLSALVTQIGNKLPKEGCNFQIINTHLENLSLEHFQGKPVDIIMSEPYYEILQGWNLACALNYHYIIKSLKQRGLVKADALSVPSYASVKCCAIEFHHCVTDAHCGLNVKAECICTFKHKDAILYGQNFHTHDMIFPLWQYKWKKLSDTFTVAKITYEGDVKSMLIHGDGEWSKVKMLRAGTCHGIVHWIDYGLRVKDGNNSSGQDESVFRVMSTGNRYNQQSIRMLSSPITIQQKDVGLLELLVKPLFQDAIEGIEDYSFEIKVKKNI